MEHYSELEAFFGREIVDGRQSTLHKALIDLEQLEKADLQMNQAYPLLIWSTIDLLSRYVSGQLENQRSMVRIKKYLKNYLKHDRRDTQLLLLFRNAVSHSVSLYAFDPSSKREVRFKLVDSGALVQQKSSVQYWINTKEFKDRLVESIEQYQAALNTSEHLEKQFFKVYKKLGYIHQ